MNASTDTVDECSAYVRLARRMNIRADVAILQFIERNVHTPSREHIRHDVADRGLAAV